MGRDTQVRISNAGRRTLRGEPLDVHRQLSFTESQYDRLQKKKKETGVSIQEIVRRAVDEKLDESGTSETAPPYIPMLGDIPAGPATEVRPASPGMYIRPPYNDLPKDCYALAVNGNSMESEFGITVKNGFYALFAPGVMFPNMIVHVEFSNGQFEHTATLKRYVPRGDGKAEFRPLNKNHKPIIAKEGTFTIRGGFIRAWDGISEWETPEVKKESPKVNRPRPQSYSFGGR